MLRSDRASSGRTITVFDEEQTPWLPVDTIIGEELVPATDAALNDLASMAKRIKRVTLWGTSVLIGLTLGLWLLTIADGNRVVARIVAGGAAVTALLVVVQRRGLWHGDSRWSGWYGKLIVEPDLPAYSQFVLHQVQAGKRRVRYLRGQSGMPKQLSVELLRGPFGPLILSSDPQVQSLALWDMLGGDRLSIEVGKAIETTIENRAAGNREPVLEETVSTVPVRIDNGSISSASEPSYPPALLALSPSGTTPKDIADFAAEIAPAPTPPFVPDPRLTMDASLLIKILEKAYPMEIRGRVDELTVDAMMVANELYRELNPQQIKPLVGWVTQCLKSANGVPVLLQSVTGQGASRTPYVPVHQKIAEAGYPKVGRRENSDSSEWMAQAFTGRYTSIRETLDTAEGQVGAL